MDAIETAFRRGVALGERRARPGPHLRSFNEDLEAALAALRDELARAEGGPVGPVERPALEMPR